MKLKKIASLALAGLMAVGMLAGCAGAADEPTDDGKDTVTNSLSESLITELNKNETIKKLGITEGDTATVASQLNAVVEKYGNDKMTNGYLTTFTATQATTAYQGIQMQKAFADYIKAGTAISGMMDNKDLKENVVVAKVYAVNASVSNAKIVDDIVKDISTSVSGLPKEKDIDNASTNAMKKGIVCDYTISAAYVEDSINYDYHASNDGTVKYIAVVVTGVGRVNA